mmetsp:Transcript_10417/g.28688  ORF Transcript_10417/g.28688 Transcript_10417/m.28688 type:complete len:81 (-) Transcript_10417:294-536(-)
MLMGTFSSSKHISSNSCTNFQSSNTSSIRHKKTSMHTHLHSLQQAIRFCPLAMRRRLMGHLNRNQHQLMYLARQNKALET